VEHRSFIRRLTLDADKPLEQIRAFCVKVAEETHGREPFDAIVMTEDAGRRISPTIEQLKETPSPLLDGVAVHVEPDASKANEKAVELVTKGRRVLLVEGG